MFVGDFIFKGSIGRTDLPTGDPKAMLTSLKKLIKYDNMLLYPGHGKSTSLDEEKACNPYFQGLE